MKNIQGRKCTVCTLCRADPYLDRIRGINVDSAFKKVPNPSKYGFNLAEIFEYGFHFADIFEYGVHFAEIFDYGFHFAEIFEYGFHFSEMFEYGFHFAEIFEYGFHFAKIFESKVRIFTPMCQQHLSS